MIIRKRVARKSITCGTAAFADMKGFALGAPCIAGLVLADCIGMQKCHKDPSHGIPPMAKYSRRFPDELHSFCNVWVAGAYPIMGMACDPWMARAPDCCTWRQISDPTQPFQAPA